MSDSLEERVRALAEMVRASRETVDELRARVALYRPPPANLDEWSQPVPAGADERAA